MESEKEQYEKKIASLEAQLKEYVDFTYIAGEHAGKLLSRIRSLEAALSLDEKNVENMTVEIYEFETGCKWEYADEREKKNWQSYAVRTLITIRRIAGMEVSDGE